MTATVDRPMTTPPAGSTERLDPWRGFDGEAWRESRRRRRLHPRQLHARTPATRPSSPARPSAPPTLWGALQPHVRRGARARHLRRRPGHPGDDHRARARLHRPRPRADRRPADRRAAASGRSCPTAACGWSRTGCRPTATSSTRPSREIFTKYRKTHNDGVFDAYTADDAAPPASAGIITGLPDAYGRGRIIGDYRRVALYGVDRLIDDQAGRARPRSTSAPSTEDVIRDREELAEQIRALGELTADGRVLRLRHLRPGRAPRARRSSGCTSPTSPRSRSRTAPRCRSGRTSTFLDVYLAARPRRGRARPRPARRSWSTTSSSSCGSSGSCARPSTTQLFSGDPTWVTESIGGMGDDGRTAGHPDVASATCRPSTTSARRPSRT